MQASRQQGKSWRSRHITPNKNGATSAQREPILERVKKCFGMDAPHPMMRQQYVAMSMARIIEWRTGKIDKQTVDDMIANAH